MFDFDRITTLLKMDGATGSASGGGSGGGNTSGSVPDGTRTPWYKTGKGLMWLNAGIQFGLQLNSMLGTPSEYDGPKGDITMGMNQGYDLILNVAGLLGPVGLLVQAGMIGNTLLGNVAKKLGGGTDGMTTTDAILGSQFLQLTPLGLVNGFGGKKSDVFNLDHYTASQSQYSYGGTNRNFQDALSISGKKYGTFSSGARKHANMQIATAGRILNRLGQLIHNRDMINEAMGNTSDLYNTGYLNELTGGDQMVATAKCGIKITRKNLNIARRISSKVRATNKMKPVKAENGGELGLWEAGKTPDGLLLYTNQYNDWFIMDENGQYQLYKKNGGGDNFNTHGISYNKQGGEFLFDVSIFKEGGKPKRKYSYEEYLAIVNPKHPEWYDYKSHYNDDDLYPEWESRYEEWINNPNRKDEEFPHSTDKYKTDKHPTYSDEGYGWKKNGEDWVFYASPRQLKNWTFDLYKDYWNYAEPTSKLVYGLQEYFSNPKFPLEFKEGGKLDPNLIPEGALHARKHTIEQSIPELKDEITHKGIPVITKEGGEIIQHAEIECNEIIFSKEVTDKIEKLYKEYNETEDKSKKDEIAIQCGKLLLDLIINNTIDKTGLRNETE